MPPNTTNNQEEQATSAPLPISRDTSAHSPADHQNAGASSPADHHDAGASSPADHHDVSKPKPSEGTPGKLKIVPLESFYETLVRAYPNLDVKRLATAFQKGINKANDPAGTGMINFYEHYARPEQLSRELVRIILGIPAFRQPIFNNLDLFLGPRKTGMSEQVFLQSMLPFILLINRAMASAQIISPQTTDDPSLAANYLALQKFDASKSNPRPADISPPTVETAAHAAPPASATAAARLADFTLDLRKMANSGQLDDHKLIERLSALEENIQTMVLAKRFFGRKGPFTFLPALSSPADKTRILTFNSVLQLAILEDQMLYFQKQLNSFIHSSLRHTDPGTPDAPAMISSEIRGAAAGSMRVTRGNTAEENPSLLHPGLRETMPAAETEWVGETASPHSEVPDQTGPATPSAPPKRSGPPPLPKSPPLQQTPPQPVSPAIKQAGERCTELLTRLMKISDRITELQGDASESGTVEKMRIEAEIATARAKAAEQATQDALKQIFEHRHSWFALTESSRLSSLKQRGLQILSGLQKKLEEIKDSDAVDSMKWPEIAFSDNRASLIPHNVQDMSEDLEQIIDNLRADAYQLEEQFYSAKKIRDDADANFKKIGQRTAAMIEYLKSPVTKTIIDCYNGLSEISGKEQ